MQTENDTSKPENEPQQETGEGCSGASCSTFRAEVRASDGPAFGAYLAGSAKDGEAKIFLNLKLCLKVDNDPRGCAAETLAHEVLHACQDIMGQALTEKDIIENLNRINDIETVVCEDEEQMMQDMLNEMGAMHHELDALRGKSEAAIKGALRSTIDAHGSITKQNVESATKRILGILSSNACLSHGDDSATPQAR